MKRPTKNSLREIGIMNPYNLAELGPKPQVYVDYRPAERGHWEQWAAWQVVHVGFQSDPNGFWRDTGHKTFEAARRAESALQLAAAQAWAAERYHIAAWERSPFGSYHPAGTIAAAVARKTAEKAGVG